MNIGEALAALPQTRILRSAARAVVFGKGNHERVESEDCVRNPVADREDEAGLPVMRHGAAGIDLGSEVHWVCAPKINGKGRDVATFGATTPELEKMAFWLKERKVDTVALESVRSIHQHQFKAMPLEHFMRCDPVNSGALMASPAEWP